MSRVVAHWIGGPSDRRKASRRQIEAEGSHSARGAAAGSAGNVHELPGRVANDRAWYRSRGIWRARALSVTRERLVVYVAEGVSEQSAGFVYELDYRLNIVSVLPGGY